MKMIAAVFLDNFRRLKGNIIALVIMCGLVLLPALYVWFSLLAFWNPEENTGNLDVAVANCDEGYQSDLIPTRINAGDQVESELRANNKFHWVFVDKDEAIEGVESGQYYAALIIPQDFSKDMLSVFSDNIENPTIQYYVNEKENPIAPHLTSIGATTLQNDIDQTFSQAVTDIALSTNSDLMQFLDGEGITTYASTLVNHLDSAIEEMTTDASQIRAFSTLLQQSQTLIETTSTALESTEAITDKVTPLIDETKSGLDAATNSLDDAQLADGSTLECQTNSLKSSLDSLDSDAENIAQNLEQGAQALTDSAQPLLASIEAVRTSLNTTADVLQESADSLSVSRDKLTTAISTNDLEEVRRIISDNPETFSQILTAPTKLEKQAIYEVANYGSAMSPFYTSLGLFIGAIFLVIILKARLTPERRAQLGNPKPYQEYFGNLGFFLVIALAQALLVCTGELFFLGVQCDNIFLYYLAGFTCSLVFVNLIYALVTAFGDIGKALAVLLLVAQVAGSGGELPIQLSAPLFQDIYPWLPFTHSMNLFQGAIAGIYANQYLISWTCLLAFIVPALFLGLVLRHPIMKLNDFIDAQLEKTGVL